MKSISKQKLTKLILKTLKCKTELRLKKVNRKNHDSWDSLAHLEIIFFIRKKSK